MTEPEDHGGPPRWLEPVLRPLDRARQGFLRFTYWKPVSAMRWIIGRALIVAILVMIWPIVLLRLAFEFIFAARSDNEPKTIQGTVLCAYDEAVAEAQRLFPSTGQHSTGDSTGRGG